MKKTISVILSVLMILSCLSVSAFAAAQLGDDVFEPTVIAENTVTPDSGNLTINADFTVPAGLSFTVKSDFTLTIRGLVTINGIFINEGKVIVERGGGLVIAKNADFTNRGSLTIDKYSGFTLAFGGSAANFGTISGLENPQYISIAGTLTNAYTLPTDFTVTYTADETYDKTAHAVNFGIAYLKDTEAESDLSYLDAENYTYGSGATVSVRYNTPLYVLVSADADFIDASRLQLNAGGKLIYAENITDSFRGIFRVTAKSENNVLKATTFRGVASTAYNDVVKQFTIVLPRNEKAYYTITQDGRVDKVTVNYGEPLSFRLVLSDAYNTSDPKVYAITSSVDDIANIYNAENELRPDAYGYYTLNVDRDDIGAYVLSDDTSVGVRGDARIIIANVVSNSATDMYSGILGMFRRMFNIFKSIFSYFADLFAGNAKFDDFAKIFDEI